MNIAISFLFLLFLPATALARDDAEGCYRLHLSEWKPLAKHGADDIYMTPPEAIRLTDIPDHSWDKSGLKVEPALGAKQSVHNMSYWIRKEGKISIVWTTGFAGVSMDLAETKQGLEGLATSFWDFGRPEQTSRVSAQGEPCDQK